MNKSEFIIAQSLAAVCNEHAFTRDSHSAREAALETLPELLDGNDEFELNDTSFEQLMTAYFLCTYCHTPKKHAIKRSINRLIRQNLIANGIYDSEAITIPNRPRPRILVVTNHFASTHVMFRCYAKSLALMKERFECVNLCLHKTDFVAASLFHRVIMAHIAPVPYLDIMRQLRDTIIKEAPDVILYADIAMHPFCVFLSNLRLAPLQVVTTGHPAPSNCEQIDAYICEDSYKGKTADYLEPVAFYPEDRFAVQDPLTGPLEPPRATPERINIVIPTAIHKVTFPFLETLARVQKETGAQLHMTSNITKGNDALAEMIRLVVPGIEYYPALHYDEYMKLLSRMELFLMPYPFSGFSTILDCFTQGVPGVVMQGTGIESHQGVNMVKRGGYENSLVAVHEMDYLRAALILARGTTVRNEMRDALRQLYGTNRWHYLTLFSSPSNGIADTIERLLTKKPK